MAIRYSKGESKGYTPLPEGNFHLRFDSAEQTTNSKGNPQLVVSTTVVDGSYAGRHPKLYLSLLPTAVWKFEQLCEAFGLEPLDTGEVDDEGLPIRGFEEQELVGRVGLFKVEVREYKSKKTNDFSIIEASEFDPFAGGEEEADDDEDEVEDEVEDEEVEEEVVEAAPKSEAKPKGKPKAKAAEGGTKGMRRRPRRPVTS